MLFSLASINACMTLRYIIHWLVQNRYCMTRHNQERAQWSPDPFPHERVGSGHETIYTSKLSTYSLTTLSQECVDNCDHKMNAISLIGSLPNLNKRLLLYLIRFLKVSYSLASFPQAWEQGQLPVPRVRAHTCTHAGTHTRAHTLTRAHAHTHTCTHTHTHTLSLSPHNNINQN